MLAFSPLIYRDLFHASDVGTMKVNEIANLADVSPDTVRFYNREGLLRPRKDPRNGYNLYNSEDLWRLRFVRVANKLGFNLREVKVILSHGTEGCSGQLIPDSILRFSSAATGGMPPLNV